MLTYSIKLFFKGETLAADRKCVFASISLFNITIFFWVLVGSFGTFTIIIHILGAVPKLK